MTHQSQSGFINMLMAIMMAVLLSACSGGGGGDDTPEPPDMPEPDTPDLTMPEVEEPDQSLFISDVLVPSGLAMAAGVLLGDLVEDPEGESIFSLLTPEDFVVINFNSPVGEQLNECSLTSTQCFVLGPDDPNSGGMFRVFIGNDSFGNFNFNTTRAVGVNLGRFGLPGEFLLTPAFADIEQVAELDDSFLASDDDFTLLGQDANGFTMASDDFVDSFFARTPIVIDGITNAYSNEIIGRAGTNTPELQNVIVAGQIGFTLAIDDAIEGARAAYIAELEADPTLDDNVIDLPTLEAAIESVVGEEINDSDGVFQLAFDNFGLPLEENFVRPTLQ